MRSKFCQSNNLDITMKRVAVLPIALAILMHLSFSSNCSAQTRKFELTPSDNAFMCPFLTPIFMRELTKSGAQEIRKDDQLNIIFFLPLDATLDSAGVYRIAGEVGFQSKFFTLKTSEK